MIYGFVDNCTMVGCQLLLMSYSRLRFIYVTTLQATLTAHIGGKEVSTVVSTSDLSVTTGKVSTVANVVNVVVI